MRCPLAGFGVDDDKGCPTCGISPIRPPVILSMEETLYRALYKHEEKAAQQLAEELAKVVSDYLLNAESGRMPTR